MPNITCPLCGNRGNSDSEDEFEVRGQYEGRSVRKCLRCEAGLLIGAFSGGMFGKPKVVPPVVWRRMEEMWASEFGGQGGDGENEAAENGPEMTEDERVRRLRLVLDRLNSGELEEPSVKSQLLLSDESVGVVSRELVLLKAAAVQIALQSVTQVTARLSYDHLFRQWSDQLTQASGSDFSALVRDRFARYSKCLQEKSGGSPRDLQELIGIGQAFGDFCKVSGGAIIGLGSSVFAEILHMAREVFMTGRTGEDSNQDDLCERLVQQCEEIATRLGKSSDSSANLLALLLPDASELHSCSKIATDANASLWEIVSLRFFCVDLALVSVYGQDERFETLRELHGGMWGEVFGDLGEINNQRYAEYAQAVTEMEEGKSYGETLGRRFTELTNGPDIVVLTAVGGFAHTVLVTYTKMLKRLA